MPGSRPWWGDINSHTWASISTGQVRPLFEAAEALTADLPSPRGPRSRGGAFLAYGRIRRLGFAAETGLHAMRGSFGPFDRVPNSRSGRSHGRPEVLLSASTTAIARVKIGAVEVPAAERYFLTFVIPTTV